VGKCAARGTTGSHADDAHPFSVNAGVVDTVDMFNSKGAAPGTKVVVALHKFAAPHAWRRAGSFTAVIWACHSAQRELEMIGWKK